MPASHEVADSLCLRVTRIIPASPECVFSAWTNAEQLRLWWGPSGVRCRSAELDLRVGGRYRIANEMPDGSVLWISGEYEEIEKPNRLVFTWLVEAVSSATERVSVNFNKHEDGTELQITHESISTMELYQQHQSGWGGCMDGLESYLSASVDTA